MFTLQTHSLEYLSPLVLNSREASGSSRNNHKLPPRIEPSRVLVTIYGPQMAISRKHFLTLVRLPPKSRGHLPWDSRPQAAVSEPPHLHCSLKPRSKNKHGVSQRSLKVLKKIPSWGLETTPPQHKLGVISFSLDGKEKKWPNSDYCSLQSNTKPAAFSKITAPAEKRTKHPTKSTACPWDLLSLEKSHCLRIPF